MTRRVLAAALCAALAAPASAQEKSEWSIGDPSPEEQLVLELINRARLDPAGEGVRIAADYGSSAVKTTVDAFLGADPAGWTRAENQQAWQQYVARPPLAPSAKLLTVSHGWSLAMRTADTVAQSLPGTQGLLTRVSASGYSAAWTAQLLQGFAKDPLHAYASWSIDWGQPHDPGTGRPFLPNRDALVNQQDVAFLRFVEAGVGIVRRPSPPPGGVGPLVVTLTLAAPNDENARFVTGVVFDDRDGDGFYDVGEGLAGVRIDVDGADHYALSSPSGGYAVPVSGNAGTVQVTARGTPGRASELFRTRTASGDTHAFGGRDNVKLDFVLEPRGLPPETSVVPGDVGTAAADATTTFDAHVPELDPLRPLVGDVDVDIDLDHADRTRLQVVLEAPDGTRATLWEGGAGGDGLHGSFDRTLRPREPLAVFVDRPAQGTWRLHVADAAGSPAQVRAWALRLRPRWEGPLHAPHPHLFLPGLRVKDRKKAGGDALRLDADIDVGEVLDPSASSHVVLILRDVDAPWAERLRMPLAGTPGAATAATVVPEAPVVEFDASPNGTSRARLHVLASGVDLPELPDRVRVEIALGDLLVSEDVPLARGRFAGRRTPPLGGSFLVERVRTAAHVAGRKTVVRGRVLRRNIPVVPGVAELRVGSESGLWLHGPQAVQGSRALYAPAGRVSRLLLDVRTGRFTARVVGPRDALDDDGHARVSLWLDGWYGAADVVPAVVDGDARY